MAKGKPTKKVAVKAPKKANPILEDENLNEDEEVEETETEDEESEDTEDEEDESEESDSDEESEDDESEEDEEEEEKPVKKPVKKAPAQEEVKAPANIDVSMTKDAARMKAILAKEPKVRFFVPLFPGEKKGTIESVWQNGHRTDVPKGTWVEIATSTADILANHYNMEVTAGADFKLDRFKDGQNVRDALS